MKKIVPIVVIFTSQQPCVPVISERGTHGSVRSEPWECKLLGCTRAGRWFMRTRMSEL